ncbi:MAG: flagellin [Tepidanaerobacteraceae bacterium]
MRINNNIMALNTHRQLSINNTNTSKSLEKLSSGYRINRAGDDAAGLAISEKMRAQIRGLNMASKNAQDGISLIQTAEGALTEVHEILQRMRELAVQSANDTNVTVDRSEIQKEIDQLAAEITRISGTTQFNTQNLLTGEFNATFHIGANSGQSVKLHISNMSAEALNVEGYKPTDVKGVTGLQVTSKDGTEVTIKYVEASATGATTTASYNSGVITVTLGTDSDGNISATHQSIKSALEGVSGAPISVGTTDDFVEATVVSEVLEDTVVNTSKGGIDVSDQTAADAAIKTINEAIEKVSAERSKLGAMQNRLEHTIKNLDTSAENLQAAESRIRDVDMAKEMMEFTKQNILMQAATAMLAQANMAPQTVLQLLG